MSAAYDPTLPLGAAITFCVYRLFAKRKNRAPDGPYWGNSPVWGALGTTLLGLVAGGLVCVNVDPKTFEILLRSCCRILGVGTAGLGATADCAVWPVLPLPPMSERPALPPAHIPVVVPLLQRLGPVLCSCVASMQWRVLGSNARVLGAWLTRLAELPVCRCCC